MKKFLEEVISYIDDAEKYIGSGGEYPEIFEQAKKLLANGEWISVKDRLPEENLRALCFIQKDGIQILCFGKYGGRMTWQGDEYNYELNEVTHWMPLPEPPKP